jgi:hypothetical protein
MEKLGLSVREVGWVLGKTESQVRRMLRNGRLSYAVEKAKIDPDSVWEQLPDDESRELRCLALWALRRGRIGAPAPASRYGPPAPIGVVIQLVAWAMVNG